MRYRSLVILLFVISIIGWVTTTLLAQSDTPDMLSLRVNLPSQSNIDLSFELPDLWRPIEAPNLDENITLLGRFELDSLGLETRTAIAAITLVEADNVLDVLTSGDGFTFPVAEFLTEPTAVDENSGEASAILENGLESYLTTVELSPGIFGLIQGVADTATLEDIQPDIEQILATMLVQLPEESTATLPPTIVPTPTPRSCPYFAQFQIRAVTAINSEEGATGRDFGRDGDQINLDYAIGPPLPSGGVNSGTARQFEGRWSADMQGGASVTDIIELGRNICDDNFGISLELWEDDSTPFGEVKTVLGEPHLYPAG